MLQETFITTFILFYFTCADGISAILNNLYHFFSMLLWVVFKGPLFGCHYWAKEIGVLASSGG